MAHSGAPPRRGIAVLGAAVLAACLAAACLAAAAPSIADGPGRDGHDDHEVGATAQLRIVTYNTGSRLRPGTAMKDLAVLMSKHPDVIALQELASPDKRARIREKYVACDRCHWAAKMPHRPVPGETPVLYRSDRFDLVGSGSVEVTPPTYVGAAGAGPRTISAKYVNWVHLRDRRTGRPLFVLNNHAVPSVEDRSGGPNHRYPRRLKLFRQHMNGLQDIVTRITKKPWGHVFVTGDLNVNFRRDRVLAPAMFPYRKLGEVGLRASYQALHAPRVGTHSLPSGVDVRLIDYVYFLPRRSLEASAQRVLRGFASDHRPLVVDFDVKISPHARAAASEPPVS